MRAARSARAGASRAVHRRASAAVAAGSSTPATTSPPASTTAASGSRKAATTTAVTLRDQGRDGTAADTGPAGYTLRANSGRISEFRYLHTGGSTS